MGKSSWVKDRKKKEDKTKGWQGAKNTPSAQKDNKTNKDNMIKANKMEQGAKKVSSAGQSNGENPNKRKRPEDRGLRLKGNLGRNLTNKSRRWEQQQYCSWTKQREESWPRRSRSRRTDWRH
jgi:hypothetical protein